MKKTDLSKLGLELDEIVSSKTYQSLERNLRELRTVIACICAQQEDLTISIPFEALEMSAGMQLEARSDRDAGCFVFSIVKPDVAPDTKEGDVSPDHPVGNVVVLHPGNPVGTLNGLVDDLDH